MLEALWPTRCAGCGRLHDGRLCRNCIPVGVFRVPLEDCPVQGVFTLTGYDAPLGQALRTAKFRPDRGLAWVLARHFGVEMAHALRGGGFSAIVPAPSPLMRRVRRGFSLPAILAAELSKATGVGVKYALSSRPGARQATLNAKARRLNLRGRIRSRVQVPGTVLLVDDVVTTGATADACARELLGDGTDKVWLLTACAQRSRGLS